MRRIALSDLRPGEILRQPIYGATGALLLAKGKEITRHFLDSLTDWGISAVFVDDNGPSRRNPTPEELTAGHTKARALVENLMSEIRSSGHPEIQPAAFQMGSAVLELAESPDILSLLAQGKTESSYIPHHMVNVGVLSVLLGKWLRLSSESLAELAVAGVLHDVGMASLPPHILSKPGGLTEGEYALVKTHPTLGHELVASELGADSIPALACLEHHERTNGSGYPRGLKADETRITSRIVAVADVYDAMSSKRSYHSRHPEFWVLSQLQENGFDILDPTVTRAMVDHLAQSIHGHRVRLNNGQIGRIVFVNDQDPSRPVVEVGPALIDLSTRPDLALVAEVED